MMQRQKTKWRSHSWSKVAEAHRKIIYSSVVCYQVAVRQHCAFQLANRRCWSPITRNRAHFTHNSMFSSVVLELKLDRQHAGSCIALLRGHTREETRFVNSNLFYFAFLQATVWEHFRLDRELFFGKHHQTGFFNRIWNLLSPSESINGGTSLMLIRFTNNLVRWLSKYVENDKLFWREIPDDFFWKCLISKWNITF